MYRWQEELADRRAANPLCPQLRRQRDGVAARRSCDRRSKTIIDFIRTVSSGQLS
jgi:hypothetical protein